MVDRQPCPRCKKILEYYAKKYPFTPTLIDEGERYSPVKSWTITGKGGSTATLHSFKCPICGKGWRTT